MDTERDLAREGDQIIIRTAEGETLISLQCDALPTNAKWFQTSDIPYRATMSVDFQEADGVYTAVFEKNPMAYLDSQLNLGHVFTAEVKLPEGRTMSYLFVLPTTRMMQGPDSAKLVGS